MLAEIYLLRCLEKYATAMSFWISLKNKNTFSVCSASPKNKNKTKKLSKVGRQKGGDASPPPVACKFLQTTSTPLRSPHTATQTPPPSL